MQATMSEDQALRESVSESWWMVLVWGIASIILGLFLLFSPQMTTVVLVQIMGAFWLVGGVIDVFGSLRHREKRGWGWKLIGAIIGIIVGFLVLINPYTGAWLAATFALYLLAFSAIMNGFVNMFFGNAVRTGVGGGWSWGSFFLGLLQLILGLFLLFNPVPGVLALAWIIGIVLIVFGVMGVFFSFQIKGLAKA